MTRLERALLALRQAGAGHGPDVLDARSLLAVTLLYLVAVLSVPVYQPQMLVWMAAYPILMAPALQTTYGSVFAKSLFVLPVVLLIGAFNPIIDRHVAFHAMGMDISRGWLSFLSIVLRGFLAAQALLLLIHAVGFNQMCHAMSRLGVPSVLATQLLMVYRYMGVLIDEALGMHRARQARGYGRRSYPLKMWGVFIGQLLLRTLERSRRIHRAMVARGFCGTMPLSSPGRWTWRDTLLVVGCAAAFAAMRFINLSQWVVSL